MFDIFTMVSNGNYKVKAEVRGNGDYFDLLSNCVNMMIENRKIEPYNYHTWKRESMRS
jgi:hypothetical protein